MRAFEPPLIEKGNFGQRPYSPCAEKPPVIVSAILPASMPDAELRSGRRVRARFFRLCSGWIAVIPNDLMLGPFGGLRPAAIATLAHIDRTEGMGTRVGAVLACRPGDLVFEPRDSVPGRRR